MSAAIVIGGLFYICALCVGIITIRDGLYPDGTMKTEYGWRAACIALGLIQIAGPPLVLACIKGWLP